ncbi:hypothetical protein [Bradyrhizobium sp.]|uniref:hypothetical protein n=1 Tax=Bradyrhizobium sp. TaxID=376 RepID=UPI002622A0CD|nr:hypothetical protein [Bradyrhizobium sp.]
MIGVTVDDEDFRRLAELIKFSSGADSRPQAREPGAKNDYARHAFSDSLQGGAATRRTL